MTWYIIGLIIVILAIAYFYFRHYSANHHAQRKLPFLAEYLLKYPECKTDDDKNARCYHCTSDKVIFQPLTKQVNSRFKHVCLNCTYTLFRS